MGKRILVTGSQGTGKTSIAEDILKREYNKHESIYVGHFMGYGQKDILNVPRHEKKGLLKFRKISGPLADEWLITTSAITSFFFENFLISDQFPSLLSIL